MQDSVLTNYARLLAYLGINALAWIVYSIGLIGSLTPSQGLPSVLELMAFIGGPSLLLLFCSTLADTRAVKNFTLLELILLLCVSAYLLWFLIQH